MWWGRGDSSKLGEQERQTLDNLRRLTETGHIVALDPDKTEVAEAAVDFFDNWSSVLTLLSSLKNVALLVGALLAMWWATEGWIVEFIQRAVEN